MNVIIILVVIILLVVIFTRCVCYITRDNYKEINILDNYMKKVYPDIKVYPHINTLNFFYACVPKNIFTIFGPLYDIAKENYIPPPCNVLWKPIWFPTGCMAVNRYIPTAWWLYYEDFRNTQWVEVMHTPDDNPYYPVIGYWAYQTTGSGVFMNVGKTLVVRNKVEALYLLLGKSMKKIVNVIRGAKYMIHSGVGYKLINDISQGMFPNKTLDESLHLLTEKILYNNTNYLVDRVNNTADWDEIIVRMANKQGFDSVQFVVQANGNGGWCHELVFTGMPKEYLNKPVEKTWLGWPWINNRLLSTAGLCTFNHSKSYDIVTCDEQGISHDSLCTNPPIIPPPYPN